jgi:hypothetical protein
MSEKKEHDIHDFIRSSQRAIEEEYERILKRATEDPGTAGDQGEENWASLLKQWLPSYFHVVTKGRILTESGYASPQVDVLVLMPSYPKILLDKKLYLAGGVAAVFECKTTLKAEHIKSAARTCAEIKVNLKKNEGTPYKELNAPILYGLLAHSHSWKSAKSTPVDNIEASLLASDQEFVTHPIQSLDFICVADLATWRPIKMTFLSPQGTGAVLLKAVGIPEGFAQSGFIRSAIGQEKQAEFFSPLGALLSGLYLKLSWTFTDMRNLSEYFGGVRMSGTGFGQMQTRRWPISIYSEKCRGRVYAGMLSNGESYDEWSLVFM